MSHGMVVTIQQDFEDNIRFWLDEPQLGPDAARAYLFSCKPEQLPHWTDPDSVRGHGQAIFKALCEHPVVESVLKQMQDQNDRSKNPLYFHLRVAEAVDFIWETLCDERGRFLALNVQSPIARIAPSNPLPLPVRPFPRSLRLAALISALHVRGKREWNALRNACINAQKQGLEISLRVYVGEPNLLADIQQEIGDGLDHVECFAIPEDESVLHDELEEFRPHVLHFFCHGVEHVGVLRLELATQTDWTAGQANKPLTVDVRDMAGWKGLEQVWLVTLNCCKSSYGDSYQQSMAYQLVSRGIPAAVGMLEPVDALDAHVFCGRFYKAMLETLVHIKDELKTAPAAAAPAVEWAGALWAARVGLAGRVNRDRARDREWALPVLYVRNSAFRVRKPVVELAAEKFRQILETSRFLASLPDSTPLTLREAILSSLGDDIPPEIRPDAYGNLPNSDVV